LARLCATTSRLLCWQAMPVAAAQSPRIMIVSLLVRG
jgi:hypothetical protein